MDFTPEKSFSSNYKNSQLILTAAAALSQNSQIAVQQKRLRVRSAGSKILIFKEMHVVRKVLQLRISLCSLSQFRWKHCVRNPVCNPKISLNWTGCNFVAFAVVCHLKRANSICGIFFRITRFVFVLVHKWVSRWISWRELLARRRFLHSNNFVFWEIKFSQRKIELGKSKYLLCYELSHL